MLVNDGEMRVTDEMIIHSGSGLNGPAIKTRTFFRLLFIYTLFFLVEPGHWYPVSLELLEVIFQYLLNSDFFQFIQKKKNLKFIFIFKNIGYFYYLKIFY